MSGDQNGIPQFDFSELSWGEEKALARVNLLIQKAQAENEADLLTEAHNSMDAYMAKVVTHVPRDYLVKSAPDKIDWTDPASMNYVRGGKMGDLRDEMIKAKKGN